MRKNGWQTPHHGLQIATWVVFPILALAFFFLYSPFISASYRLIATACYGATVIAIVVSVWLCTSCDPSDTNCEASPLSPMNANTDSARVFCNVCMRYVRKRSRHCRLCDKCVDVFDHHCKWLNNCIGTKNYRYFLASVLSTSLLLSVQLFFGVYILCQTYKDPPAIQRRSAIAFGCKYGKSSDDLCILSKYHFPFVFIKIIHGVLVGWLVPSWLMIIQLTMFHIQLCMERMTTYDYIVRKRKRKLARDRDNTPRKSLWQVCLDFSCCRRSNRNLTERTRKDDLRKLSELCHENEMEDEMIEAEVEDELEISSNGQSSRRRRSCSSVAVPTLDFPPALARSLPPPIPPREGSWFDRAKAGRYSLQDTMLVDNPSTVSEEGPYIRAPQTPASPQVQQRHSVAECEVSVALPEPMKASVVYV